MVDASKHRDPPARKIRRLHMALVDGAGVRWDYAGEHLGLRQLPEMEDVIRRADTAFLLDVGDSRAVPTDELLGLVRSRLFKEGSGPGVGEASVVEARSNIGGVAAVCYVFD